MAIALAHHAGSVFNADFYTVAATVIPVLFLAIAIQGRIFENLLTGSDSIVGTASAAMERGGIRGTTKVLVETGAGIISLIMYFTAVAVVILGCLGEMVAVQALYDHGPAGQPDWVVFAAVILLTVVTAGSPYLRIVWARMEEGVASAHKRIAAQEAEATDPAGEPPLATEPTQPAPGPLSSRP
jgi:hypothetical protein